LTRGILFGGLDGVGLRERIGAGELTCVAVAEAFLEALDDDPLHAWAAVDSAAVLATAAALDASSDAVRRRLPLFGLPVGVKDTLDTADLPTAYGSPIYAGHRPAADAQAVRRLRSAGAVIAGKTKCAEFAWMSPPDTLNPLDRTRTPGGSSSGSAAAVAAGTVPLAIGTQTAGSINRPASYCGVLGYKPTFGSFPRGGLLPAAASLDTVGVFARTVRDLRLAAEALAASDPADPTLRRAQPFPLEGDAAPTPRIGLARTPDWAEVEPDAQAAIEALARAAFRAGADVSEVELPAHFEDLVAAQAIIQWVESAIALEPELAGHPALLSAELRAAIEEGAAIPLKRYVAARRTAARLAPGVIEVLSGFDGVLTPSTTGVPPLGLDFTGDPLFCRAWTLVGGPSISLPIAWTPGGLPAGVQVVGAPYSDGRTIDCAGWMIDWLGPITV
jgi:Asp-tRNA(Asn)/Glu-tRNA(Gln) amidotransferase A subunit family amidase